LNALERRMADSLDREWVLEAVRRHERPLLAYVGRMLGDADRGRDVVQDAFLQLCKQPRTEVEPKLAPWLYAVCRRRVVDILRKERRMVLGSAAASAVMETAPGRERNPAEAAEARDDTRAALACLEQLPAQQQEAVRLKFQQQFSYREIGEVMGLSESHVGVLLHQALKTLRHRLAPRVGLAAGGL
jgi:RNA polymerase sigma factor (sigma-70 family)